MAQDDSNVSAEASERESEHESGRTGADRSRTTKPGRLAVSELAASFAGSPSPFGDDLTLPLPPEDLTYNSGRSE
ncbi:MAG TPA: hypothetical protein VFR35_10470 [Actinoplanes sp.]|nr:hypothetical protein [Actinoplanes sp.]